MINRQINFETFLTNIRGTNSAKTSFVSISNNLKDMHVQKIVGASS